MRRVYSAAGVDTDTERDLSAYAKSICSETYTFSPFVEVNEFSPHFRGPRGFRLKHLDLTSISHAGSADGIGTKTIVIDAAAAHADAAADLLAMTGGDITRWGGLPLVFFNILEVASFNNDRAAVVGATMRLLEGLRRCARDQNVVCLSGEIAQEGPCIGSEIAHSRTRFNWSGVMTGVYHHDRLITGTAIDAGDSIIALREYGFRSNGWSAVRMALRKKFGRRWWRQAVAREFISRAVRPATLYDRLLVEANGWYDLLPGTDMHKRIPVHAIVHITGGGIPEKFGPLLAARGLSAELDDLWEPPEVMRQCAEWLEMPDSECYRVWGCGQGALVVVPKGTERPFIDRAASHGIAARVCGRVVLGRTPTIMISVHSKFSNGQISYKV